MAQQYSPEPDWRHKEIKIDRFVYEMAAGILLIVAAVLVGLTLFPDDKGFQGNLYTTVLGVLITIFVLDRRAERREALRAEAELKARLIREMGSKVNEVVIRAVEELRAKRWLTDGSLRGQILSSARLQGTTMIHADFQGTHLFGANLEESILLGANMTGATLMKANLRGTTLLGAEFTRAKLRWANLEGAHMSGASLEGASLLDSNMQFADIRDVRFDQSTRLPDGTYWTPDTDMRRFTDPTHPQFWRSDDPGSPAYGDETT